jgi:hypothetical protein
MEENMNHFLLQNWPAWWQNSGLTLANGALKSFEKNALANFWRDIGNLITGGGAGWAATRDSFFNRHFRGNQHFPARNATERALPWLQYLLLVGRLGVFSPIFLLVGFGPGKREFESSMSIGPFTTSGKGDELIGRVMFGGFGLLTALGTLWHTLTRPLQLLGIWHARRQG